MCSYDSFHSLSTSGRREGLMISVLDCGLRGLGSRPGRSGHFWAKHFTFTVFLSNQSPVVQRIDISIQWWITIQRISVHKTYCAIQRIGLSTHRTTGARSINVFQRNVKEAWWNAGGWGGGPCEGLASHPVGNSNTPCRSMLHRNRDKLPLDGTLDSSTDFSLKILLTYSQGHFWQLWNFWVFDSTL